MNVFLRAIKPTNKSPDDVINELLLTYVSDKLHRDEIIRYNAVNADCYAMANNRIPKWANKPNQFNHTIIWSYFRAEEINGHATIDLMKGLCFDKINMSEKQFKSNYAQMTFDGPRSHGKVFEDDGENVWIWEEIKPRLMQYKNAFHLFIFTHFMRSVFRNLQISSKNKI